MNEEANNTQAAVNPAQSTVDNLMNKIKPKLDRQIVRHQTLYQRALEITRSHNSAIGHPAALAVFNLEWADDYIRRTYRLLAMLHSPDQIAIIQSPDQTNRMLAQSLLALKVHSDACEDAIVVAQMCLDLAEKRLRTAESVLRCAGSTAVPSPQSPGELKVTDLIL
jgi:hypothetical protein